MPNCSTPGAHYQIRIEPRVVEIRVCLPEALTLNLTESEAISVENRLHDALERTLKPYLPQIPDTYVLIWKGKGPMPHLAVGTVLDKSEKAYTVQLTREEWAWLADDWTFNDDWDTLHLADWHT